MLYLWRKGDQPRPGRSTECTQLKIRTCNDSTLDQFLSWFKHPGKHGQGSGCHIIAHDEAQTTFCTIITSEMILLPIINLYLKSHAESRDIKHPKTPERYLFGFNSKCQPPFKSMFHSPQVIFWLLVARAFQSQSWSTRLVVIWNSNYLQSSVFTLAKGTFGGLIILFDCAMLTFPQ